MKTDAWGIVFSILCMFVGVFEFIVEHDRPWWWTWLNGMGWIGLGFLLLAGSNRAEIFVIASPIVVILLGIGELSVQHRTSWTWFSGLASIGIGVLLLAQLSQLQWHGNSPQDYRDSRSTPIIT